MTKKSSTHGLLRKSQPPVCPRFPRGIERQERKGAVPGQEDGKDRGEGRACNQVHRKEEEKQCSPPHHVEAKGNGSQGKSEHSDQSCAWQNDVKASVYKAWQISPICRLLVEGAFLLDGTKCFHDKPKGRSVMRDVKKGRSSRAASGDKCQSRYQSCSNCATEAL